MRRSTVFYLLVAAIATMVISSSIVLARGLPYGGIENLRPETKALVKSMAAWMKPKGK